MNKIININNYRQNKQKDSKKMLFLSIIIGLLAGLVLWKYFVENIANYDVKIPQSANIKFNEKEPIGMTTAQVAVEFENFDDKPVLLYIYTTWCGVCTRNFEVFNEISREFQNTDLKVMALAIDRNLEAQKITDYFNKFGDVYFQPRYLIFKDGFIEFLHKKNIKYSGHIPFTVLIGKNGEVISKYTGVKNKNYLRNRIIKELYPN
jgi:peroxiredoxin